MLVGPDTSTWKRDLEISRIKADFTYTKATEGNYFVDDSCDMLVERAKAAGKKWGVFHFATNLKTDPITEADFFVNNCLGYIGKGILILDNESYRWQSDGSLANDPGNVAWCKAWLDRVFARTGVRPLIYMSASVVNSHDWSSVYGSDYGLIVAAYVDDNTPIPNYQMDANRSPDVNWGPAGYVMWQFTSTGRLDGYGGNLDCNFFFGTEHAWDLFAGVHDNIPVPAPVPTPVTTTAQVTETNPVKFQTRTENVPTLNLGETSVLTAGVDGIETVTYNVTYVDGVETSRTVASDTITTQPVTEVIGIGTYIKPDDPKPTPTPTPDKPVDMTAIQSLIKAIVDFIIGLARGIFKK